MLRRNARLLAIGGGRGAGTGPPPRMWRRLFHVCAGSIIPIAGIFVEERLMVWGLAAAAGGFLAVDLARINLGWLNRRYLRWFAPLLKADESAQVTAATYMVIAALLVFLLYGKDVAVPVMLFLSLGDPAAALLGAKMPGPRIRGKSPGGTLGFTAVAAAAAAVLVLSGGIEHHWALWAGAGVAAMVELASLPPDDNFTVPLLAGTAMHFLGA